MLYGGGDRYEGGWIQGKRSGRGTCLYANGDKYRGEWESGLRHGYGVCVFKDGTKYRGEWDQDEWVQSSADPELTKVFGPGISRAIAGQQATFGIQAYDDLRNKRLCGGDNFVCKLVGPGKAQAEVEADQAQTEIEAERWLRAPHYWAR